MEVASLQQPPATEPVANTVEPSMDIDMDIDLGPLPEPDAIETVRISLLLCDDKSSLNLMLRCIGLPPAAPSPARRRCRPAHRRSPA